MKKSIYITMCSLVLSAALFISCGSKAKGNLNLTPLSIETIKGSTEQFDIEVDPRIELMGIVCHLAGYYTFNYSGWSTDSYIMMIDTMFGKYKNEPAVKTARKMGKNIIDNKFVIDIAYMIKPDFSGINYDLNNPSEDFTELTKKYNAAQVETFVKQLNDFAHKTNFEKFYGLNRSEYKTQIALLISAIDGDKEHKIKCEQWFKDFYKGYGYERATISVSRVTEGWSYFAKVADENGNKNPYLVVSSNCNTYWVVVMNSVLKSYYLVDAHWDEIKEPVKELYRKWKVKNNAAYDIVEKLQISWLLCDAFNTDFLLKCWDENQKQALIDDAIKTYRFEEFPLLVNVVDDYVVNPEKYPDFDCIYPELLKLIEAM